ncbi:MAG: DUF11 domain-containing protein [Oscillatoriales cyanobacterium]|nr:MAG: DUF11 domain-containing protein [Oscillatoriales cyanobacterium]
MYCLSLPKQWPEIRYHQSTCFITWNLPITVGSAPGTLPTPTPDADLAVTKTDGQTTATPGTLLSYTVTVTNNSSCYIKGISFTDNLPASLTGVTWTASLSGVGAFPTAADRSGSGNNINTKLDLDAGSTATYIVTGTVANSAIDTTISNTATATPPEGIVDKIVSNNNSATDLTAVAANQPPVTASPSTTVNPGSTVPVTGLGATDADGTIASYTVNTLPPAAQGVLFLGDPATGGVAVIAGQTLTPAQISQLFFKSTGTFNGANFTYSATDDKGATSPATATLGAIALPAPLGRRYSRIIANHFFVLMREPGQGLHQHTYYVACVNL